VKPPSISSTWASASAKTASPLPPGRARIRPAQRQEAALRVTGDGDGIGLVAAEHDDGVVGLAEPEADMALARVAAAREHGDAADARLAERGAPLQIRARQQRARRGDADAFEAGAAEGRAPGDLVLHHVGMADVAEEGDDARVVAIAALFDLAELAPGLLEPACVVHDGSFDYASTGRPALRPCPSPPGGADVAEERIV
jgi:hypothetical protein